MARNFALDLNNCLKMCERNLDSIIHAKILSNHFREISKEYSPLLRNTNLFMNLQKSNSVISFLTRTEELIKEGKVDGEAFKNAIIQTVEKQLLHCEILWFLEVLKILPLVELISHYEDKNENVIEYISSEVYKNILKCDTSESKLRNEMVLDYIIAIFESSNRERKDSVYSKILSSISNNVKLFYKNEENYSERNLNLSMLIHLLNCAKVDQISLQKFFQEMLIIILEGPTQTVKFIAKKQEKLQTSVKELKLVNFFKIISKYFNANNMTAIIQNVLLDAPRGVDWDCMLCFISFIGVHYTGGWSSLKTLSNAFLTESFKTLNTSVLSYAFFIARQGCFEKATAFQSYLQWFSSSFSSKTKLISNEKLCNFFFNFLIDLIPYESAYYLKVHINRQPWVPADYHWILDHYITLVKDQLCDLNVSTELGICENMTEKSTAKFDVENVLKHFEKTNEILSSVFQASLFSKNYYEKKFLVELLSKFDGKNSVRHNVVMKLHSIGKIPKGLFKNYKSLEKNCK